MSAPFYVPICLTVPTGVLSGGMLKFPFSVTTARLTRVDGYLRALTLGPYVVTLKSVFDGRTLATLTWNAPGLQTALCPDIANSTLDQVGDGLQVDTGGGAVAPQDCCLTTWWLIDI